MLMAFGGRLTKFKRYLRRTARVPFAKESSKTKSSSNGTMYQESEQQPAPPLPTGTMSLCIGCRTFPLEDFFPEQKYGSYTHSEDAPWKTWSPDTTLADTSKAFWLGTIAEVRLRAQNCDLCAFALDSDCAFWEVVNTSSESDGLGLQETMATVRSLPDECRVCIFRWPLTRPKFFVRDEGYVNSRDRQGRVIVAASTHAACNIPETILRERFGAINDAGWRQDQEIKVQRWDKDTHCGGSHVPMQWIETKLNVCLTKHKSCAVPYKSFGPDSMMSLATIRLVDIERRIVIERTLRGAEYAVLSYVWYVNSYFDSRAPGLVQFLGMVIISDIIRQQKLV